jgi:hypothetical protein
MASQRDYSVVATALLALIRHEVDVVMPQVPFFLRGKIPVDKEPEVAATLAKAAVDALDADRVKQKTEQNT